MKTNPSKKNINWINAVKAISIIAVYFVHSQIYYGFLLGKANNYIHPFYVNAFFFVSGYLLFRKQLSAPQIEQNLGTYLSRNGGGGNELLINILYRIIIPSTLFASIEFIPKNIIRHTTFNINDFVWETIGGGTYWFTSALVVAQIIILIMLLTRYRNLWPYWLFSLVILAGGMCMVKNNLNFLGLSHDFWQFKHGLYSVAFITAGGLYWKYEDFIQRLMKKWSVALLLILYIVVFSVWAEDLDVLVSTLTLNWTGYFAGCFASIVLIELCRLLPTIKVLTFIGQNSISFYFMSGAFPIIMGIAVNKFLISPTWYGLVIVWFSSLAIAYCATYLMNKFIPWIFDIRLLKKKS